MIPFENQVYSLKLAKRLNELGVKQERYCPWFAYGGEKRVAYLLAAENSIGPLVSRLRGA